MSCQHNLKECPQVCVRGAAQPAMGRLSCGGRILWGPEHGLPSCPRQPAEGTVPRGPGGCQVGLQGVRVLPCRPPLTLSPETHQAHSWAGHTGPCACPHACQAQCPQQRDLSRRLGATSSRKPSWSSQLPRSSSLTARQTKGERERDSSIFRVKELRPWLLRNHLHLIFS